MIIETEHFYRPKTKFAKVMFSQVSTGGGGLSAPLHAGIHPQTRGRHPPGPEADTPWADIPQQIPPGRHPPGRHPLPLGRHHPGRHPQADTPLGRRPLGRHSPCALHAGIRSTSGRYASHWNAFLSSFILIQTLFVRIQFLNTILKYKN